jgi:hypothetical protein
MVRAGRGAAPVTVASASANNNAICGNTGTRKRNSQASPPIAASQMVATSCSPSTALGTRAWRCSHGTAIKMTTPHHQA